MNLISRNQSYLYAAAICLGATILSWISEAPSSCFHLAVVICSLYGTRRVGIFSVCLSILSFEYFFLSPHVQFSVARADYPRFAAFIATAVCINLVIAAKQRGDNALRISESYLAAAQRMSHTGSFGWNVSSGEIVWSAETFRIANIDPNEKPNLQLLRERIHPEDRAAVEEAIETSSKRSANFDFDFEHRFVWPDGSIKFVRILGKAVHDKAGQLQYIGAAMDITSSKLASELLQRLEDKLARASQLATLSAVSASIAHEVNQPLAAIIANAHMCSEALSDDCGELDKARSLIKEVLDCGYHASNVVQQVRNLFKGGKVVKVSLDINEVAKEVLHLIRSEATKRRVRIEIDLEPELPEVLGDRVQIQQVLVNLCINGFDAMESLMDGARILSVRTRVHDQAAIRVEIHDNGSGLHDLDKIFEAFYTTKENGMGLGLPICRSIIESHSGRLWPRVDDRSGTTFCFTMPVLTADLG
jgi:signal transduction histidine kinase